MTALVQQIAAVLNPLAAGGAWFGTNFSEATYPYITFFRVVNASNMTMDGPTDLQSAIVQIDCYAKDAPTLDALSKSVQAAMLAGFVVGAITQRDLPADPQVQVYRTTADFTVWSTSQ